MRPSTTFFPTTRLVDLRGLLLFRVDLDFGAVMFRPRRPAVVKPPSEGKPPAKFPPPIAVDVVVVADVVDAVVAVVVAGGGLLAASGIDAAVE